MRLNKLLYLFALLFSVTAHAAVNIQHWQTSQGAEVYFVENHDLPIIDISTNFYAGSAYDTPEKSGLAGITRYLMSMGAGGVNEEDIAKRMADIGARLGGDFDVDRASFKLRSLSSKAEFDQALSLYTSILQKPDFPEPILAREKERIISSIEEAATQPESIASKAFMQALYGKHPYALDESGEVDTVRNITRSDLQTFYQNHYGVKGAVIALMGDMTASQAASVAENIASGLPRSPRATPVVDVAYPAQPIEQRIAHPASQAHILMGYPGIKRGDPDYFPLYVGNYILGGGGFVSRLTEEVREKRGLAYSVYSYFMPMATLGPFQIGLQTKKEQAAQALQVVRDTLDQYMQQGVTDAELKAATQNIVGGFPLRLDSNSKILDYLSVIGFYQLPLTYLDDFNKQVSAVTAAQIKQAFQRRIDTSKLVTIIVGSDEQSSKN